MVSIDDKSTRGKTRPGRLRMVDRWLNAELHGGFEPKLAVDFGAGEHAWTTLELAAALRKESREKIRVIAVENDPRRVANLREESRDEFEVLESGFHLPVSDVGFIRCMNVLRQYPIDEANEAYETLCRALAEDGLLACGTTDKGGDIGTFWRYESNGERRLVVFTSGERGFAPRQFRDFLPRDIRRAPHRRNPFLRWLPDWEAAWQSTRGQKAPIDAFDASIRALASRSGPRLIAPGIAELPHL